MSGLHFYEHSPLNQSKIASLFEKFSEMMDRAEVLGDELIENIGAVHDDELIHIFINEPLWLERLEHLNAARYKTASDLSHIKDELSPDEIFHVKTSMSEAKLVGQEMSNMLRKVKTEMRARNLSLAPNYGEAFMSECLDKPQYGGGITPNIYTFIQEIEKFFTAVRIPLALQGSYIEKNCLSSKALDSVNHCLPIGKQVTKEDIFQVLLRKFGNTLYLKEILMREHRNIGKLFSNGGNHNTFEWSKVNKSCLQHLQMISSFEDIMDTVGNSVLSSEYLITLKHVLPTEVISRTTFDTEKDLRSTFYMIKAEFIKMEDISSQCLIEKDILEIRKDTKVVDKSKHGTSQSGKHQHESFKHCVCRLCKLLVPGPNLTPRLHKVTRNGFPVKDECPFILSLDQFDRSDLLAENKICRSCLSMKVNAGAHGPEGSCRYLEIKNLVQLKCDEHGCSLRKSLCNHNHNQPCKSDNVESHRMITATTMENEVIGEKSTETIEGSEADLSKNNSILSVEGNLKRLDIKKLLHLKFDKSNIDKSPDGVATEREESISSVGRDKAIVEAEYQRKIEKITNHEKTNLSNLTFKGGTLYSEVKKRKGKSFVKQNIANLSAVNSNLVTISETLVSGYQRKESTLRDGDNQVPGLWRNIFKLIVFKGLNVLIDTGQDLF